jgi:hypothetical protein
MSAVVAPPRNQLKNHWLRQIQSLESQPLYTQRTGGITRVRIEPKARFLSNMWRSNRVWDAEQATVKLLCALQLYVGTRATSGREKSTIGAAASSALV